MMKSPTNPQLQNQRLPVMESPTLTEIKDSDYRVHYDEERQTVTFQGELQLSGMGDYAPIITLLDQVVDQAPPSLTLDLRKLEFLNSSGINMLFRLVIKVRETGTVKLVIRGSDRVAWQSTSLANLQRLMPTVQLTLE